MLNSLVKMAYLPKLFDTSFYRDLSAPCLTYCYDSDEILLRRLLIWARLYSRLHSCQTSYHIQWINWFSFSTLDLTKICGCVPSTKHSPLPGRGYTQTKIGLVHKKKKWSHSTSNKDVACFQYLQVIMNDENRDTGETILCNLYPLLILYLQSSVSGSVFIPYLFYID